MSCSFCASGRPTVLVFQIRSALELVDLKKPNLLLSWTCGDEECQLELMTTEAIDLRLWSDIRDFSSIYWGRLHRFMSVSRTLSLLFEGRTWTQSKVTSETMAPPANMVPKYENMIWFPSAHMSCIATEFLQSAACSQKRCLMLHDWTQRHTGQNRSSTLSVVLWMTVPSARLLLLSPSE